MPRSLAYWMIDLMSDWEYTWSVAGALYAPALLSAGKEMLSYANDWSAKSSHTNHDTVEWL